MDHIRLLYIYQRQPNDLEKYVEVEFRVVAHRICKLLWLKKLLEELKVTSLMPMKHYCDNKTVINMAHNSVQHDKTKHVKVD